MPCLTHQFAVLGVNRPMTMTKRDQERESRWEVCSRKSTHTHAHPHTGHEQERSGGEWERVAWREGDSASNLVAG